VSHTSASLALIVLLFGLAVYFLFAPPPGFGEGILYRLILPFLLVSSAFGVAENLRTRAHIGQLVGALRGLMGKTGKTASPKVRAEAIEILLGSLRSDKASVRRTASVQLGQLTGQDFGEDREAWEDWWNANRAGFLAKGKG